MDILFQELNIIETTTHEQSAIFVDLIELLTISGYISIWMSAAQRFTGPKTVLQTAFG